MLSDDDDDDSLCGAALADTDSDEEPQACDEVAVESSSSSEDSSSSESSSSSCSSASSPSPSSSTAARDAQEAGEERRRCDRQEALPLFKGAMAKLKAAAAAAASSGSEQSTAAGLALQAAAQLELFLRFLDGKALAAAEAEELHAACDLLGGGGADVREALQGLVASDAPFDAKTALSALLSWRVRLFQQFDSEEHAFRADEAFSSAVGQPVSHGGRKRLLTPGPKRPLF
jgi:hypothetical protein